MKKAFKIFCLCTVLMLSACSNNTEDADVGQPSASLESQVDFTETEGQPSEISQYQTDVSESVSEEEYISDEEAGFLNALENLSAFGGGMLYDFDYDNIPEVVIFDYGMEENFYNVFRYDSGEFLYMGEMRANSGFTENAANIDLYCSKTDREYFYCANPVAFVKNNSSDTEGYGFYCSNLCKYVFSPNGMESSVIASFTENSDDEEALKKYLQDCEDYLSRFEKITSVNFEPLWNAGDMTDGTYKEIIARELESKYHLE